MGKFTDKTKIKIIVLADIHSAQNTNTQCPERETKFADTLLLRAVHRINRYLQPDITLLLGDFVDDSDSKELEKIKDIINSLTCPWIALPGNHDGNTDRFFEIFPHLPDYLDIKGCRFIPFVDREQPGCNAVRSKSDIRRMESLAKNFNGPVVTCHHVPLFKPKTMDVSYNYINAEEIISTMCSCGITCSLAGHYHNGFISRHQPFGTSIACPALCEKPFRFLEIAIGESGKMSTNEHRLAMDKNLCLTDFHVHSRFAYCNENMDFEKSLKLAELFNISRIFFTEHSSHLYFAKKDPERTHCLLPNYNLNQHSPHLRFQNFLDAVSNYDKNRCGVGTEVDCGFDGGSIIRDKDIDKFDILFGALHSFPQTQITSKEAETMFRSMLAKFVQKFPMHVLAHPFRIFKRYNIDIDISNDLRAFVVKLLKKHSIAAEINFHTNEPSKKFFQMCLEEKVSIAFGSDAHNLYEIGEFYPHISFLKQIGADKEFALLKMENKIKSA